MSRKVTKKCFIMSNVGKKTLKYHCYYDIKLRTLPVLQSLASSVPAFSVVHLCDQL